MVSFLPNEKPDPNDIVIFRSGTAIVLHAPGVTPHHWIACHSYDEALDRGKQLARKHNVDFWVAERDVVCLLERRRARDGP